jgi:hypothetical protein
MMLDAALLTIVLGSVLIALAVDLGFLATWLAWLRSRWRAVR